MTVKEISVSSIHAGRRPRDLGDVEALAKSMADIGQIHPIVITPKKDLVLGERRVAAAKLLGWDTIRAEVTSDIRVALSCLEAEAVEPVEQQDMAPSHKIRLGFLLEMMYDPKTRERDRNKRFQETIRAQRKGQTVVRNDRGMSELIADAVGLSRVQYHRAKHIVVTALSDPDPHLRQMAREQQGAMDRTGQISGPYGTLRKVTRSAAAFQSVGAVAPPITGAAQQRRALNNALTQLGGVTDGLACIVELDSAIGPDEASQYIAGLARSRRVLERMINNLRRRVVTGEETT
jgi:ParB family chromosome partitioning protein